MSASDEARGAHSAACVISTEQCSAASSTHSCADSTNPDSPYISIKLKHMSGFVEDYKTTSSATLSSIKQHIVEDRGLDDVSRVRLISAKLRRALCADDAALQYADVMDGDVLFVLIQFRGD